MSKQLYEKCELCDGTGEISSGKRMMIDGLKEPLVKLENGNYFCFGCKGEKYLPIGLTVGQIERMRAELDRFKAGAPV